MIDYSEYAINPKDVKNCLENVPPKLRGTVAGMLFSLSDLEKRYGARFETSADGAGKLYHHPHPPLDILFALNHDEELIRIERIEVFKFKPRVQVFVSYAHANMQWFEEVVPFFKILDRRKQLCILSDRDLEPGEDYRQRLREFIETSRLAVLLVTQQFMASDFILDDELPLIWERHESGKSEVHWMLYSPAVIFEEGSPFNRLQAAHPTRPPLCDLTLSDREKVYARVAKKLLKRVKELDQ